MKQGSKGSKKVAKSTVAFTNSVADEVNASLAAPKGDDKPLSRSDQPFAKSGLRKRSPIGTGRLVERLGSHVVEKRVAATESTEVYRCTHALTGESVIAKVLRQDDNYNERMRFDTQLAHLENGKLDGVRFVTHGKCAVGRYFLVEDGGDEVIDRLTD